ncbi:hypothetical protein [Mangrovibrevibacter kandeliae]|uniref:hypothetical protein n=1 Tax=Mangrovibrevibacter kandeliae TaxID=2968473 RepID=UPI003555D7A6
MTVETKEPHSAGLPSGTDRRPAVGPMVFGRRLPLPATRGRRIVLGCALVAGGILGFLPILGFWMIPLGLFVLSQDLAVVRRWRRRATLQWGRRGGRRSRPPSGSPTSGGRGAI